MHEMTQELDRLLTGAYTTGLNAWPVPRPRGLLPTQIRWAVGALARIRRFGGVADVVRLDILHWRIRGLAPKGGPLLRAYFGCLGSLLSRLEPQRIQSLRASLATDYDASHAYGPECWRHIEAALESLHPNGYRREAAVHELRQCVERGESSELPLWYLLARTDDWVKEVAQPALDAFSLAVEQSAPAALFLALPLVSTIESSGRHFREEVGQIVHDHLQSEAAVRALVEGLSSASGAIRRQCVERILESSPLEHSEELRRHSNEAVRLRYLSWVSSEGPSAERSRELEASLSDSSPVLRAKALRTLASSPWEDVQDFYYRALSDRSRRVRDIGRYHVQKHEGQSFVRDHLLEMIQRKAEGWRFAAVGLAELPHTAAERSMDDALLAGAIGPKEQADPTGIHLSSVLTARSVLALGALEANEPTPAAFMAGLHAALQEPRTAVRIAAAKAIERLAHPPEIDLLESLASQLFAASESQAENTKGSGWTHIRLIPLIRASRALGEWDSLRFLLGLPGESQPWLAPVMERELQSWFSRCGLRSTQLAPAQTLSRTSNEFSLVRISALEGVLSDRLAGAIRSTIP